MCCVSINLYSTGSGKELHVRRSPWALPPMGAHSHCLIQLLVPFEFQQLDQDYLDHSHKRQASLATMRYTTQTIWHSVKNYKSIKRSDKNSGRSRGNERGGIVIQKYYYTGCHRRNGPNFGRVFLMLNYTDITQNTYIQSWTVTEIIAREVWNFDTCYTLTDCQIHIETGRNMWFL